ncbi:hypothetical protein G9A89_017790 [Geosiphon pyriformis]|nr:hypothetical protein G9A89_017790 [Geosiphon pyriformis]
MSEEQNFHHTALSKGRATAQQQNSFYNHTIIPPARIAENANLSDIFPFEFKANESPFLLSNAAANEQKTITAMYTEAEVEEKTICLILDNGSTGNWETQKLQISYQGQHVRVPATCGIFNKRSEKALAFEFEPEEEKPIIETFMALGLMSNWANEIEQEHFTLHSEPKTPEWNIPYSKIEPRKQHPYIPLKYKNCHKKLSSIRACILSKKEYESHTCYYCKGHLIKRSRKWDGTSCLTCGKQLPNECDWIDVAFRERVYDQTCQYAFSIAEKVKCGILFNAAYNSTLSKLYHYSHDAKIIYELAMVLINRGTKEDVLQMKEAEYIEYTLKLAGFDYENKVECPKCYTLSIPLSSKSDEYEIEFREFEATEKIETTPIYLIENQPASQLKYFNNNGQGIKPEKAHEIDAGYNL